MTVMSKSEFVDLVVRGGNRHHHKALVRDFPNLAYTKIKTNGKIFIYDNRPKNIKHGQLPIGEVIENYLYINGKKAIRGSIRKCLEYVEENIINEIR